MFQLEPRVLGARCYTVHLEEAAFKPATAESEFIVAISLNPFPEGVFKMVEHDVAGRSLFTGLVGIRASEGPVFSANTDALVHRDGLLSDVHFQIRLRNFSFAAPIRFQEELDSRPLIPL